MSKTMHYKIARCFSLPPCRQATEGLLELKSFYGGNEKQKATSWPASNNPFTAMSSPPEFVLLHNRRNRRVIILGFTTQSSGFIKNYSYIKVTGVWRLDRSNVCYIRRVWPLFASGTECAHEWFVCFCVLAATLDPKHTEVPCTAAGPATAPRKGTAGYTLYRRTAPTLPFSRSESTSAKSSQRRPPVNLADYLFLFRELKSPSHTMLASSVS